MYYHSGTSNDQGLALVTIGFCIYLAGQHDITISLQICQICVLYWSSSIHLDISIKRICHILLYLRTEPKLSHSDMEDVVSVRITSHRGIIHPCQDLPVEGNTFKQHGFSWVS
jgi:hypothetical protein